ncbi:MAG TPA: hypothetical protein VNN77_05330 [candidate division Zixibacteria bacterium]|nr:hypothetical protein [candidate division Zixibacteria bacterium]
MKSKISGLSIALVLLTAVSGQARPRSAEELIAFLEEAQKDCEWKTRNLTGGPKGRMLLHKRIMDDVLERLKAGQPVDPRKLEQALAVHGG